MRSNKEKIEETVVTTTKKLFIYVGSELIGMAGVQNSKDFDYTMLYRIAKAKHTVFEA